MDPTKRFEINPPIFHHLVGKTALSVMLYLATLYLMTVTYFLKVKDSNRNQFGRLNVIISQTMTNRASITIANLGSRLLTFDLFIIFDLGPF